MFSKAELCNCDQNENLCKRNSTMLEKFNAGIKPRMDINYNNRGKGKTIEIKKEEVMAIRNRFPTKIPIMVQRYAKESYLPHLDKSKFLVPQEITMSQFQTIIRSRVCINGNQSLFLLINNRSLASLSLTIAEVYSEHARPDGFLYVTYASQEAFGNKELASAPSSGSTLKART